MGTRDLTHLRSLVDGLPPAAAPHVAAYLSALDEALDSLPRAERSRFLTEAADALGYEVDNGIAAGASPHAAARTAVEGFGAPAMLAAQVAAAIAPGTARRTGAVLMTTGPLVGLAWIAAIGDGHAWSTRVGSVLATVPSVVPLLAATVACAMAAVLSGWLCAGSVRRARWAAGAARAAALGCVAADALLLSVGVQHGQASGPAAGAWLLGALALSALRLIGAAGAGYRLSRLRAAVC